MHQHRAIEIFYLFFQGALCFQVLIFFILYLITKRKYLLLYSLFLLLAASHFFINAPATFFNIPEEKAWQSPWYNLLNEPVIIAMNFSYLLFLKNFYADIPQHTNIKKLFTTATWIAPALLALFVIFTIADVNRDIIFFGVNIISLLPAVAIIVYAFKTNLPFSRFLLYGLICYASGTLLTILMNLLRNMEVRHLFTFGYPLLFIRLGVLGDMFFLLLVILKKWHWQEQQLAVEKISTQLTMEKLRNKLSMELHDDIGATLSGLSMYGHLAGEQLKNGDTTSVQNSLTVIQESAIEMVNKLNDIVWFTNPTQDNLPKLIQHIEEYARKMTRAKGILVEIHTDPISQHQQLSIEKRRNIYLLCKEAINNAVKYSEGTLLELKVVQEKDIIAFSVIDNGKGFDAATVRKGNGLDNMQQRADDIGAKLLLQSNEEEGTIISIRLKIT
ncbi:MAG: hypothetical protein J0I84_23495 [Terrimonas sp.]|nr:hypothetical protein [Terrimonas sp.]OJY94039.1 MAG: hypothetical protein BGP13_02055 [Sphingobacteriales bacterium 40-81]